MSIKSKSGSHNTRHRNLLIVSVLIIVIIFSFTAYLFVANNSSYGVVHVKSEEELVKAINNVKNYTSAIIILDNDIDLTTTIIIPPHKNITLTSNGDNAFRLVGPYHRITNLLIAVATLHVETDGILILDGIVVTHPSGSEGRAVYVDWGGQLFMYSGEISGNAATGEGGVCVGDGYGGGVSNGGTFIMYGGTISGNKAQNGGGVSNGGTFIMYGGEIFGNTASYGGGVYNGGDGIFNRSGGEIYGNTADNGENVYP